MICNDCVDSARRKGIDLLMAGDAAVHCDDECRLFFLYLLNCLGRETVGIIALGEHIKHIGSEPFQLLNHKCGGRYAVGIPVTENTDSLLRLQGLVDPGNGCIHILEEEG